MGRKNTPANINSNKNIHLKNSPDKSRKRLLRESWFTKKTFHYTYEETNPYIYAMACVEIVATHSKEGGMIFMLEAATETVDNSEVGKLVFYIKGYAAKLDAERRRDATGRGKMAMLKNGKLPQGVGIGIYGYHWIKESKKRIPIESEAKVVQRIFEMKANGVGCFKIAKTLNDESIPTKAGKKW